MPDFYNGQMCLPISEILIRFFALSTYAICGYMVGEKLRGMPLVLQFWSTFLSQANWITGVLQKNSPNPSVAIIRHFLSSAELVELWMCAEFGLVYQIFIYFIYASLQKSADHVFLHKVLASFLYI